VPSQPPPATVHELIGEPEHESKIKLTVVPSQFVSSDTDGDTWDDGGANEGSITNLIFP